MALGHKRVFSHSRLYKLNQLTFRFYWEGESKPELVAKMGIGKPHANNNRIERLNGTLRERVRVQRGWKTVKTPSRKANGFSITSSSRTWRWTDRLPHRSLVLA
jgi:hypothetical protein